MKVQTHISSEPLLSVQSGSDAFDKSRLFMTFLTNFGVVTGILRDFRLVLERKTGKKIIKSSRSKFLGKNFKFYQMQKGSHQNH